MCRIIDPQLNRQCPWQDVKERHLFMCGLKCTESGVASRLEPMDKGRHFPRDTLIRGQAPPVDAT